MTAVSRSVFVWEIASSLNSNKYKAFLPSTETYRRYFVTFGFRLRTGSYQIRCGILTDVASLLQALKHLNDNVSATAPTDHNANDVTVSRELLHKHPLLLTLIEYYSTKGHEDKDMNMSSLHSFLENITRNMTRPKNSYRYDEHVKRFAVSLFILAGRNAYGFASVNIPGALPSISSIQTLLDEEE